MVQSSFGGATNLEALEVVRNEYRFADILSVESMLNDLERWAPVSWTNRINEIRHWSDSLFSYLC